MGATWVKPDIIILSARSQAQKGTDCLIPCVQRVQERQDHGDGKKISGCLG